MYQLPPKFINFDLECTTWEGAAARNWSGPGEHREVVQIGAVLVDSETFEEIGNFACLVKPTINPTLSKYFIELTGITQQHVDERGAGFENALTAFAAWAKDYPLYCFDSRTDGSRLFDRDVLEENCKLLGIPFPFDRDRFRNVNMLFFENGHEVKQSASAPGVFGVEYPMRAHDALNDARGVVIGLKAMSESVG